MASFTPTICPQPPRTLEIRSQGHLKDLKGHRGISVSSWPLQLWLRSSVRGGESEEVELPSTLLKFPLNTGTLTTFRSFWFPLAGRPLPSRAASPAPLPSEALAHAALQLCLWEPLGQKPCLPTLCSHGLQQGLCLLVTASANICQVGSLTLRSPQPPSVGEMKKHMISKKGFPFAKKSPEAEDQRRKERKGEGRQSFTESRVTFAHTGPF